ncbi:Putative metal-sulfur cluster biosynthesis proteins YuaD [Roseobacter fucihabitans]|uniref:Metal-sulfur cluster biosynthesis proteins YuaD n=1 Tax=Roseobacter fucihabitans TaxID=1537242 RepID=A0ABZ2BUK7_9RHOB|nr:MOSC domain-containing protein [Roseobacter litoralis]MBC6965679.1 putative metal-sulfur cluster biosynthesis proteins YuaD [Roseobacter litoralis]
MPALLPTRYSGTVKWLGRVSDSVATLRADALESAELKFTGIDGECHGGLIRPSCVRTKAQYPKGTEIRNVRQLSVLSAEELALIAADMGLEMIDPAWVGASLVIEGIPDFSHIPPSSRLLFQSGASIAVDMENRPCILPGREIEKDRPGFGAAFKPAAENRRGVTAWVEREGPVAPGDSVTLHIPDQPVWTYFEAARR